MNDSELKKDAIANQFENAIEYSDETRDQLNEKQQYFMDELVKKGYEVRFDDVHILHRKVGSSTALTVLRSNLE